MWAMSDEQRGPLARALLMVLSGHGPITARVANLIAELDARYALRTGREPVAEAAPVDGQALARVFFDAQKSAAIGRVSDVRVSALLAVRAQVLANGTLEVGIRGKRRGAHVVRQGGGCFLCFWR